MLTAWGLNIVDQFFSNLPKNIYYFVGLVYEVPNLKPRVIGIGSALLSAIVYQQKKERERWMNN